MIERTIEVAWIRKHHVDPEYFARMICHASGQVKELRWAANRASFELGFDGGNLALDDLLAALIKKIGRMVIHKAHKTLYLHEADPKQLGADVWQEMLDLGWVTDFGGGHVAYTEGFLTLVQSLDTLFCQWAAERRARPFALPNFLPVTYLQKINTFEHYPHYMYFATPLLNDLDRIERFQAFKKDLPNFGDYLAPPTHCLKISACAPLYLALENRNFEARTLFTLCGLCTRHESKNTRTFERLTEFQMREIVYFGDEEGDREFQRDALAIFQDLIECFDLTAHIRSANDSFFLSNYSSLRLTQMLGEDKFEAALILPDGETELAFASYNRHRNFFGQRMGITYTGEQVFSACIGFGLERLAYGILCRHGLNLAKINHLLASFKAKDRIEKPSA